MKRKIGIIIISLIVLISFFSCQKIDPIMENGDIDGYAKLNNNSDNSGIEVSIEGLETLDGGFSPINTVSTLTKTKTTEDGDFILENIPAGKYIVKAEKDGYFPTKRFIEIKDNKKLTLDEPLVLYPLGDYGTLNGNVKYIDKSDQTGILLEIRTPEGEPLPGMYTFSGKNGNYSFDFIPIGNYIVYARDIEENSEYSADAAPIVIENDKNTVASDLILRKAAKHVVIFKDVSAWSEPTAVTDILDNIGFSEGPGVKQYEVKGSEEIANLSSFDSSWAIIIEGDQTDYFYDIYKSNVDKFNEFVSNGGTLFWVACDNGWNGGDFTGTLPGGVMWRDYYDNYNDITNRTHPLLTGFPDRSLVGNYASHGGFNNLDLADIDNLVVFIKENSTSEKYPTYIEYRYGDGRVIASTSPLEYYTENQSEDSEWYILLLKRSIEYTFNLPLTSVE